MIAEQDNSLAASLERLLAALLSAHRELLDVTARQRDAIRRADTADMEACLRDQLAGLARAAELERERTALVARTFPGPARGAPATLTALAGLCEGPARERLLGLAGELRALVVRLREEQAVVRAASATLLSHMDGVMKQVAQRLSHAQTYGRRGSVEPVAAVVTSLDLTT
jgi:hypothetical protein